MFKVIYDDEVLYLPELNELLLSDFTHEQIVNQIDWCKFSLPYKHLYKGKIESMKIVKIYDDEDIVFYGRTLSSDIDMETTNEITCEGSLGFLRDITLPIYETGKRGVPNNVAGYFTWIMDQYNYKADSDKRFAIGIIETDSLEPYGNVLTRKNTSCPTVWDEIQEKILDSLGGFLLVTYPNGKPTINLLSDFIDVANQSIEFGVNLLDFSITKDDSEIYTAIVPLGKKSEEIEEPLTIEGLADGPAGDSCSKVGNAVYHREARERFGYREKSVVWDDVTIAKNLLGNAEKQLQNEIIGVESIEISAFDMSLIDDKLDRIKFCSYILCKSEPHGFSQYMPCVQWSLNIIDPSKTNYVLGSPIEYLTNGSLRRIKALGSKVETTLIAVDSIRDEVESAVDIARRARTFETDDISILPSPPYYEGDLWVTHKDGLKITLTCIKTKLVYEPISLFYEANIGGTVSIEQENVIPDDGEANGCTALPDDGYVFRDWTDYLGNIVSHNPKFVPDKIDGLYVEATYYANFDIEGGD